MTLSARPFRFLAAKAAVAANFHFEYGACYYGETENSKHSKCMYTCRKAVLAIPE